MEVEVLSIQLNKGIVYIFCNDISDENLRRLERMRDDAAEEEVTFVFDTHNLKDFKFLYFWLHKQKAAKGAETWGEALQSVVGTITMIPKRYRLMS